MKRLSLRDFELKQLHYFLAVAEKKNCSISEVAEELHIAQPNLSQQIQDLEKKLKVKLFDRTKRPLKLTSAGEVFLQEVRLIFTQVNRAIETAQRAHRGEIGRLIVGFNSAVSNGVLPDILKAFRSSFPDVELILQERTAQNLIESLQTQQIDIGLMHWSSFNKEDEMLCFESIIEESLILVLPENHPLASETEISLKSLDQECFIVPPSHLSYSLYEPITSFWQLVNFVPYKTQEATLMLTMLCLVAAGVGVTLLPTNIQNLERKGVIYRKLKEKTPTVKIVSSWRRDNSSVILQEFLNVIKGFT